jgi:protease PrsW
MPSSLLTLLAVMPCIALCVWVYFLDRYDREPKAVLISSFFLGFIACMPAYFIEQIGEALSYPIRYDWLRVVVFAFIVVALTEEGVKYLFLRQYCYKQKAFNEPLDGIVYSLMVSMGFATAENLFYSYNSADITTIVIRILTAVPAHASFAVIMGYQIGLAKQNEMNLQAIADSRNERKQKTVKVRQRNGFWAAVVAHGTYDFLLFQNISEPFRLAAFGLLVIVAVYAYQLLQALLNDSEKRWQ